MHNIVLPENGRVARAHLALDGTILGVNGVAMDIYGGNPPESIYDLVTPDMQPMIQQQMLDAYRNQAPYTAQRLYINSRGEIRPYQAISTPIYLKSGTLRHFVAWGVPIVLPTRTPDCRKCGCPICLQEEAIVTIACARSVNS